MGRHSNMIVIGEDGRIIDSIKRVGEDMSSVRLVLPGVSYALPPREEKLSLIDLKPEELSAAISRLEKLELSKAIMKTLEGISPVFAREAAFYAARGGEICVSELDEATFSRQIFYFKNVSASIKAKQNKFIVLAEKDGRLKDFCFTEIHQYGALMLTKEFPTACGLLDYFFSERDRINRTKQRAEDLFKFLISTSDRISRRIAVQKDELLQCADRYKLKICGDLISSNIYRLEKGMNKTFLENFYENESPMTEIKLDNRLTPAQNAQKYYSEYKKADTAEKKLTELIKSGGEELLYIESVFDSLTRANSEADILELRAELSEQGYLKSGRLKNKLPKAQPPHKFISDDGFTIFVGRNNKQNDRLTTKDAEKTDIWCHTHNITGSHVVICTHGEELPDRTIEQACMLAAYHSSARSSAKVPVDYTLIKFVKKPNGSKPGMVIFTNNKTMFVTPEAELAERLKLKN
jgi:predicted ribosome quality control (RQC) complex YloA/Tae2 family protein